MERVETDGTWALFCPNEAPGLDEVCGEEFESLYHRYEREGRAREQIPARKLWNHILEVQIETGNPFMLYKDACNGTSYYRYNYMFRLNTFQPNLIKKTSVSSNHRISVLRSSNTLLRMKLLFVTLHRLRFPPLL